VRDRGEVISSAAVPTDCDERVRRLYDYWRSIHPAAGGLPGRQHVEPLDLAALLRWLWLIDIHPEPLRFRYRLVGTAHALVAGADPTGEWFDEASAAFEQIVAAAELTAALSGTLRYTRVARARAADRDTVHIERLVLPLAQGGASVNMLLGMTLYRQDDGVDVV
jgi:hypothetical protein